MQTTSSLQEAHRILKPAGSLRIRTGQLAPLDEIQEKLRSVGFENISVENRNPVIITARKKKM